MNTFELIKSLADDVEAKKCVKIEKTAIEDAWKVLLPVINQVNACAELDRVCGGVRLEDLRLPSFVKPFIFPPKVSLEASFEARDLVYRPAKEAEFEYDEKAVTKASYVICSTLKKTPDMKTAAELRGEPAVFSNVDFSIRNKTRLRDERLFYPVPLNDALESLLGDWSNAETDKVIQTWINRCFSVG